VFGYRVKNDKSGEPYEKTNTKDVAEYLNHARTPNNPGKLFRPA
jgi:hypothetical protein